MLAALGVYQEGVAKNVVNGKPVVSYRDNHFSTLLSEWFVTDCARIRIYDSTYVSVTRFPVA
jgi:hypothetical protein